MSRDDRESSRSAERRTPGRPAAGLVAVFLLLAATLVFAPSAGAHGIGSTAAGQSVGEFVLIGFRHMLFGWDHLLFVAGVLLVAGSARTAAKLITLFVIGHSTTLIAATLLGWRVDAKLVDIVIALSVAFIAAVGVMGRPINVRWLGLAVLGFGLVHGLGLATRFQDLGIPDNEQLPRLIAFNVGIELGQLTAIALMAAVGLVAARAIPPQNRRQAVQVMSVPLGVVGLIAPILIAINTSGLPDPPAVALPAQTSCSISGPTQIWDSTGGTHPARLFYEPGEAAPLADFGHVIGDGYVIVLYAEDTSAADVERLRDYVRAQAAQAVVAGPSAEVSGVAAYQFRHTLTCDRFEYDTLTGFAENWLDLALG